MTLPELTSLEELRIVRCEPEISCLTSLRSLGINDFPNLITFPESIRNPISLETLSIWDCPNLTTLPDDGFLKSLQKLHIYGCPQLALLGNYLKNLNKFLGQYGHGINHLDSFKIWEVDAAKRSLFGNHHLGRGFIFRQKLVGNGPRLLESLIECISEGSSGPVLLQTIVCDLQSESILQLCSLAWIKITPRSIENFQSKQIDCYLCLHSGNSSGSIYDTRGPKRHMADVLRLWQETMVRMKVYSFTEIR
nr:disease resistance protein rpp5 [Quercus suber]